MDKIPFYMVFLQSFPETLLLIYIGLVLMNARPPVKKVLLVALLNALFSYFIHDLPLPPGTNVLIQVPLIIIMLVMICKLPFNIALSSTILGFLVLVLAETGFNAIISAITGISSLEAMNSPLLRVLYPLPEFIFLGLLIIVLRHCRVNLFRLFKQQSNNFLVTKVDSKTLTVISLPVALIALGFYYQYYMERQIPEGTWYWDSNFLFIIIMLAVVLSLVLAWKMILIGRQEALMELQQYHISNLQEMMQIIKAQRHDFVNHLQVIYGLTQLGQIDQLDTYISEFYQDVQVTGEILQIAVPQLSALLLVQSGWATAHNTSLQIKVESDLAALTVPALDLVAVVGNLMRNAMEAVDGMESVYRKVELRIFENPSYYVIQTQNPGWIPPDKRSNIFDLGFSTKSVESERGIGLASVKYLVEKYQGQVIVSSHQLRGTRFTVCYPKTSERRNRA